MHLTNEVLVSIAALAKYLNTPISYFMDCTTEELQEWLNAAKELKRIEDKANKDGR